MAKGREGAGGGLCEGVVDGAAEAGPEIGGLLGRGVGDGGGGLEGENLDKLVLGVVGELEVRADDCAQVGWRGGGDNVNAR